MGRHTIINPKTGHAVLKTGALGRKLMKTHTKAVLDRAKEKRDKDKKKRQKKHGRKSTSTARATIPQGLASLCHDKFKLKIGTKMMFNGGVVKMLKRDVNGKIYWGAA